ncbi:MAG: dihydrodipicolinate synthase family protein [Rhodospirillaceae bacterium]|nr:dihydrodipicolinate synthase family protein [Rhodospirillaceae bacterium]
MSTPYRGIFPIVPTPFNEDGSLDLDGQRRVLDCMIDQGVDGLCILANYSEQFLLSDSERETLQKLCLEYVNGRVPVIATCSHFSTQIAMQRCQRAEEQGAAMVMMMPPYHGALLRANDQGVYEHFERLVNSIKIPIMVQDAPLSGVTLSVPLLARLAKDFPTVSYFKIETPGTAGKLRALMEIAGGDIDGPFDGEEGITLLADLEAGATGTMTSALACEQIRPIVIDFLEGKTKSAEQQYNKMLPLINIENRQCGLRGCKTVFKEGGVISSDVVRHPLEPLSSTARATLLKMARELDLIAIQWGN